MIDLERGETYPSAQALERLLEWCAPARGELAIDVSFPALNGTQRQRRMSESGMSLPEVYAATVAETRETYAGALEPQLKGSG
jgi:carboxylate-amine ligase